MKRLLCVLIGLFLTALSTNAAFWSKSNNQTSIQQTNQTSNSNQTTNQNQNSTQQTQTTYPQDVDGTQITDGEYVEEDIDIEKMYRDMPVPAHKYIHDIDPDEFQDTRYTTWSPYPLFRLTAPLYFKSVAIQPGYYLLTPREHQGKWYMLFKEAGKIKYIVPCYKKEMVPYNFYKNNLPQIKLTTPQKIREMGLKLVGKSLNSSKRKPVPDTFLEANDEDNNFISIIVYWGNYRYYMVLRSIQL